MDTIFDPSSTQSLPAPAPNPVDQERRRKRLQTIIDHGLPPFPHTVLELSAILNNQSPDVKKAGKIIRADPSLSAHVLRLCNSPMFGLRTRVISIEQATILIGAERLRSLAMTCSLVNYSGVGLPRDQVNIFWRHSFLAAMLSEHLAVQTDYFEKEQAYIAGLLHDIGQLPQWMLAAEERAERKTAPPADWNDNPLVEHDHFGMDHCEIGSSMAVTWNFMPSFIDILAHHHNLEEATHDPGLVEIIATVEHFLLTKDDAQQPPAGEALPPADIAKAKGNPIPQSQQRILPAFTAKYPQSLADSLNKEYDRLIPLVEVAIKHSIGGTR